MWLTFDNQDVLFLYSTPVLNNSETAEIRKKPALQKGKCGVYL